MVESDMEGSGMYYSVTITDTEELEAWRKVVKVRMAEKGMERKDLATATGYSVGSINQLFANNGVYHKRNFKASKPLVAAVCNVLHLKREDWKP